VGEHSERRRKERFPADGVFAAITVVGGCDQGFGVVTNVSEGGLCISTPIPPPQFGKVILNITVDDQHHKVHLLVRRVTQAKGGMYEAGLQFAPRCPGKQAFLESFLNRTK